mgnify:CR=1 FL=1|jgi:hypothetical protein
MNNQELIKKYEEILINGKSDFKSAHIYQTFLKELRQLDEPQKPVVQQFVADWYEEHKDDFEGNLFRCIDRMPDLFSGEELSDFEEWIVDDDTAPFQTLVNMHQFGYEVEKEKRYKVVMPNVSSTGGVLTRIKHDDSWIWIDTLGTIIEGRTHTRKELEQAGFGWVFDCPGIEIEEAEG